MEKEYMCIHQMILIGATGQNCGKTTIATELIHRWNHKFPVIGLKVTTIHKKNEVCIRGNHQCGVCTNISGTFELTEELDCTRSKDTSIMLASGARKVYWLKCLRANLKEGIREFMSQIPENTLVICESNSLRDVVNPGLFIMLTNAQRPEMKPSAEAVLHRADIVFENDYQDSIKKLLERIMIQSRRSQIEIQYDQSLKTPTFCPWYKEEVPSGTSMKQSQR